MVYHFVHEITVVAHHNHASFEILQILFQHIQRHNIEVIGRLIQHQEVGIAHQDRTQIEAAAFSPTQLVDIAVLCLGSKQEMLQELRCRQLLAVTQFYDFGNVLHYINHFHLLIKL